MDPPKATHVQSSSSCWPNNNNSRDKLCLPMTLAFNPFENIPEWASFCSSLINKYRCQSCKAFLNKFCFVRNIHEYDCSICGCTNTIDTDLNVNSEEMRNQCYRVASASNTRIIDSKRRLFAFVIDLTDYGQEARSYLLYGVHLIKDFLKNATEREADIDVMLLGFDDGLHHYSIDVAEGEEPFRIITCFGEHQRMKVVGQLGRLSQCRDNIIQILQMIQEDIKYGRLRTGYSKSIMPAVSYVLKNNLNWSGKVSVISGLRHELKEFTEKLERYFYDKQAHSSYVINRKQCIPDQIISALLKTQLSVSFFFHSNNYFNALPFYHISKVTNGEIRIYQADESLLFFYEFHRILNESLEDTTGYQALLRVRLSSGLKLLGIFGQYRASASSTDQIDLLTCPANRKLIFEFMIEGEINFNFAVVQFSILATDLAGNRYFIVETHMNKVSADQREVIRGVNYHTLNLSYVRGVLHQTDLGTKVENMAKLVAQKCKTLVRAGTLLEQGNETSKKEEDNIHATERMLRTENNEELLKEKGQEEAEVALAIESQRSILLDSNNRALLRALPYIISSFLLIKSVILQRKNNEKCFRLDLKTVYRSRILTLDDSMTIIWPLVYVVHDGGHELVDMKHKQVLRGTIAVVVDRCDRYFIYLADIALRKKIQKQNKETRQQLIEKEAKLIKVNELLQQLKSIKRMPYIQLDLIDSLDALKTLDTAHFINYVKSILEDPVKDVR